MQLARFENIVAIRAGEKLVGFHAHNLQVAHLDLAVWEALAEPESQARRLAEVREEIHAWNQEIDPEATDQNLEQKIRSYSVNVSQVCNLKCTYCAAGGDGTFGMRTKHVDFAVVEDQIARYLHDVSAGEGFDITFFGGEPLLALETIRRLSRFARLQVAGRSIDLRFRVITNATLVTDEAAELLASIGCHVTVSLDGPPEINDRQRLTPAGRGSTAAVLRGLEKLRWVRDRLGSLGCGAVFGAHNTDVLTTYKYLRSLEFDSLKFDFAASENDAAASQAFSRALLETADFAYASGGEAELRKISQFDHAFRALDQQRRIMNHCGAGKSHVYADAKGRLAACQWFLGNPREVLRGTKPAEYERSLQEMNSCGACWARNLCGGGCVFVNQLKSGSKRAKDPEFCHRTRTTLGKAIEYYAEARLIQNDSPT